MQHAPAQSFPRYAWREIALFFSALLAFTVLAVVEEAFGADEHTALVIAACLTLPAFAFFLLRLRVASLLDETGLRATSSASDLSRMTNRIYAGFFLVVAALVLVDVATNIVVRPHGWSGAAASWVFGSVWGAIFGIGLGALAMVARSNRRDFQRAYAEIERLKRDTDIAITDREAIDRVERLIRENNAKINHDALKS